MESIAAPTEGTPTSRVGEVAFRALADRLEECVFLTDRQGRYLAVNSGFARWVGRPESEILGRTAFDLWPGAVAEADAANDRRVLDGESVEREERRPFGAETRQVRSLRIPVRDETGAVQGVLGSVRDATRDRAAEEARSESARMELVGRLASGVAHDFNNLMTAVLGHLALLRDYVAAEGPHQELLGGAEKAAAQAADLSRQLLAFLRMEPAVPEPVDLNAVVGQVVGLLRRTFDPRIHIDVRLQPGLPRAPAVRTQLGQLLLNLCLNARDAMPRGGRLLIETSTAGRSRRRRGRPTNGGRRRSCGCAWPTPARGSPPPFRRECSSRPSPPRAKARGPASAWPSSKTSFGSTTAGSSTPAASARAPASTCTCPWRAGDWRSGTTETPGDS